MGMGSPLVLAGVAFTGTVGALRLHYPPLAPQKSRRNLLVPAYPGCPGSKAVKRSLLLLLLTVNANSLTGYS